MSLSPRFLDELRSRLTLSDMIGRRISVKRAGREFKACCPFHHEKTPSFTINDDKQFYHCFGCGAHGDVIGFFMRHDNLSFIEAVEMLFAEAGMQMPKPDPQAVQKAQKERDLHKLMEEARGWFSERLQEPTNKDILNYLLERGLSQDSLERFGIGYAPADGQALRRFLAAQGYKDQDMIAVGLTKESSRGGDPYTFFRDRVMFPVTDRQGRVVAFGGRVLSEHLRAPTQGDFTPPKYINSSDTPLFDKGRILYGMSQAMQAAREGHTIIVTEGYMDVIACHQAGFKGAVAPMGTAMTEDQLSAVWRMAGPEGKVPVLCFDGDNAGRRAAERAAERALPLLKAGQSVRMAFLPDGEDPDSLLRNGGAKALRSVLEASMSLFDFLFSNHTAGRKFDTPEERAGLVKALETQIRTIADGEVQKHYFSLMRQKTGEMFYQRRDNNRSGGGYKKTGKFVPAPVKPRAPAFKERYGRALLAAVINYPDIYESIEEEFAAFDLPGERLNQLRAIASVFCEDVDLYEEGGLDREALINHLKQCGFEQEINDILSESVYLHAAFVAPGGESGAVLSAWRELYKAVQGQNIGAEMKKGWKKAFDDSSEDDEEKLRHMVFADNQAE